AYDAVLNGSEVAGGSIRIHDPEMQRKVFGLIGIDEEKAERMFGWFVDAYNYGAPPHGGIAAGVDRIVAMLAGRQNIREVMAFPKSSAMTDLMTGAPDIVDRSLLKDLHLKVVAPPPD
ncbi:MAG: amino acid--tRNA ligase-related protein, partial [Actinomycetota bacterium]